MMEIMKKKTRNMKTPFNLNDNEIALTWMDCDKPRLRWNLTL